MRKSDALPVLVRGVTGALKIETLQRASLSEGHNEAWLQELLDSTPTVLPVSELDERVELPLFSLGREITTDAGPIDNLFISRNGQLVVVETKLFRNPESRRKVVAQILDYAAQVRRWTYEQLDTLARTRHSSSRLWQLVGSDDIDEARFVDRVSDNLRKGRMTLLIVGDGIHSEAEALAEIVAGSPDFQFRLALLEIRLFDLGEGLRLAIPLTLARTNEIERAIVTVNYVGALDPTSVTVQQPALKNASGGRRILSEQSFLDALREYEDGERYARIAKELLDALVSPLQATWKTAGFTISLADPNGTSQMISLFVVQAHSTSYGYRTWVRDQLAAIGVPPNRVADLVADYERTLCTFGAKPTRSGDQLNLDLVLLEKRERAFVESLVTFSRAVEKEVARTPS